MSNNPPSSSGPKLSVHKAVVVDEGEHGPLPTLVAVHYYWAKQRDGSYRGIVEFVTDPVDMTKRLDVPQALLVQLEKSLVENVEPPK